MLTILLTPLFTHYNKGLNFGSDLFLLPYLCSTNQQTKQYE
nr:MAG TPA: hypothetical protein [Caudoviricetes sp.]